MKKLSLALMILALVALQVVWPGDTVAQEGPIKVTDQTWEANFREHLTFKISAESSAEIVGVDLFYQIVGQVASSRNKADFTPGPSIEAEFVIDQTEPGNYFPPGTELQYWWKIVDADGNELRTEKETLLYLDNRYDWMTLENERLTLYWYEGSDQFGQDLFERANLALDTLENDFGVTLEDPIKLFIYANHDDFLGAYSVGAQEWTGGVAFDEYGVVMITVDPREPAWGTTVTMHEMTHLVIHRATDNPFGGDLTLPRWLDEGIAVYSSGEIYTRADFNYLLSEAIANNQLMTLRTLSSPFSSDANEAVLSYAQSGAVVDFIVETYGPEAMADLLNALAEGALYDEALQQALGTDTDGLDNAFRASLDLPPLPNTNLAEEPESSVAEPNLAKPEESVEKEGVEPQADEESAENTEDTTENTEDVTKAEPPAQSADETSESEGRGPVSLPCLAGILPLVVLGLALHVSRLTFHV
jgi:hypothetical protein